MTEGLRNLPRVQADRERQLDDGTPEDEVAAWLNCEDCNFDHEQRRLFRCGWIPTSQHLDGGGVFEDSSICPGYTIGLPEVFEAARLLVWRREGAIAALARLPLPPIAALAVDLLDSEQKRIERDDLRRQRREMKESHGSR